MKKRRFNAVDVVIVVVVAAVLAGVAWRFGFKGADLGAGAKDITYTLRIVGVRPFTVPLYEVGLNCFDSKTGEKIGVIKAVDVEEFQSTMVGRDGLPYRVTRPNSVVIYLTIETEGRETADSYFAGTAYKLKMGSEVNLATKNMDVTAVISGIEGFDNAMHFPKYTGGYERQ